MRIPYALCWPCMALGLGLVVLSSSVWASEAGGTPSWSVMFNAMLGFIIALVAAYMKGLESRIGKNEAGIAAGRSDLTGLREMVLKHYHDNTEIAALLAPMSLQLADLNKHYQRHELLLMAVHNRLDQAGIGVRPRISAPDDGN